ncbi:MAG TPA: arylesterase [Edaphobacter sp.]|jgi:acyl-CoA thioesterase-1|nr:arylesterase [Edaphobacter sp.]
MRRTAFLAILAALTTFLGGCRTDNQAKQAEQPPATAPTPPAEAALPAPKPPPTTINDNRPLIVCFGDSLTAGYGTDPGKSYPDYLQADLDAKGYHYRVVNEGVSGNTTKDGVQRVDGIVAIKPAIVIVEFGGNDGLRGFRIEDSRANLDQIVGTLKASGARIVMAGITLPPNYGPDYIKQFNETYVLLAKKYNVPLLPFLLKGVFGVDGMMQADNTHATAEGNKVVANNVLPLLLPLLKK